MNKRSLLGTSCIAVACAIALCAVNAATLQTRPTDATPTTDPMATAVLLDQLGRRPIRVHDPSTIVKCKDTYWIFCTGRGTPSFSSKDLVTWERGPRTFATSPPWVVDAVPGNRGGLDFWAPDVIHWGGRYLLYYSVSTFGKNTSAIGLATNPTLDPSDPNYRWRDQGIVIQSSSQSNFNAIDPAVAQDAEGNLWLAFGSFWSGIKLIQLDPKTGKRLAHDSPMYSLAHADSIEAPFIYRHGAYYYLFVNWGMCCRGVNSTYNIRIGRSRKITGPYVDKEGRDLLRHGGSLFLGTQGPFIGPGHAGIIKEGRYWLGCHFYDPTQRGAGTFAIRAVEWESDGWPQVREEKSSSRKSANDHH